MARGRIGDFRAEAATARARIAGFPSPTAEKGRTVVDYFRRCGRLVFDNEQDLEVRREALVEAIDTFVRSLGNTRFFEDLVSGNYPAELKAIVFSSLTDNDTLFGKARSVALFSNVLRSSALVSLKAKVLDALREDQKTYLEVCLGQSDAFVVGARTEHQKTILLSDSPLLPLFDQPELKPHVVGLLDHFYVASSNIILSFTIGCIVHLGHHDPSIFKVLEKRTDQEAKDRISNQILQPTILSVQLGEAGVLALLGTVAVLELKDAFEKLLPLLPEQGRTQRVAAEIERIRGLFYGTETATITLAEFRADAAQTKRRISELSGDQNREQRRSTVMPFFQRCSLIVLGSRYDLAVRQEVLRESIGVFNQYIGRNELFRRILGENHPTELKRAVLVEATTNRKLMLNICVEGPNVIEGDSGGQTLLRSQSPLYVLIQNQELIPEILDVISSHYPTEADHNTVSFLAAVLIDIIQIDSQGSTSILLTRRDADSFEVISGTVSLRLQYPEYCRYEFVLPIIDLLCMLQPPNIHTQFADLLSNPRVSENAKHRIRTIILGIQLGGTRPSSNPGDLN